jgi:hypothetical protein
MRWRVTGNRPKVVYCNMKCFGKLVVVVVVGVGVCVWVCVLVCEPWFMYGEGREGEPPPCAW